MNAIKFIKDHGVDKAREVVEGAPFNSTCYVFWTGKFRYINELTCEIYSEKLGGWCEANIMVLNLKNPLSELKRLVESVDKVIKLGGINEAKAELNRKSILRWITPEIQSLKQAISDYKSIYSDNDMGDDSHIENHVSPLCKVGVK